MLRIQADDASADVYEADVVFHLFVTQSGLFTLLNATALYC